MIMSVRQYKFKLKHDSGTVTLRTAASSVGSAVRIVCLAECCPESAIVKAWQMIDDKWVVVS
jgi:hypothetical protein